MKPRTKFEKKIAGLMNSMPPLSKEVITWAYKNFITPVGFTTNGKKCYCGNCGKIFKPTAKVQAEIDRIVKMKRSPCSFCNRSECYYLQKEDKTGCMMYRAIQHRDTTDAFCNHCRKKILLHVSDKKKDIRSTEIGVIMPVGGIQTQRNMMISFEFQKGEPVKHSQEDIFDVWLSEKGVMKITRVKCEEKEVDENGNRCMSLQSDQYATTFPHPCHKGYIGMFTAPDKICPKIKLTGYLKQRGMGNLSAQWLENLKKSDHGIFGKSPNSFEFMIALIKYPFVETLIKQRDFDTLNVFFSYPIETIQTIIPAFYISRRHKYIPDDLKLWIDMVMLYHRAQKDIHNPRFICPQNLQAAHQEALDLYKKHLEIENRKREEEYERTRPRDIFWYLDHHKEELKVIKEDPNRLVELDEIYGGLDPRCQYFVYEKVDEDTGEIELSLERDFLDYYELTPEKSGKLNENFTKLKSRFFNIEFGNNDLKIVSLDSLEEYRKEGNLMHNCIETNNYFLKPDSLILSVRKDGEVVADVEISLLSFKVIQCFGPCNSPTPYFAEIKELISQNIDIIKSRMR